MEYKNGFLSADISDSKSLRGIGKKVEKGQAKFNHFAMDRCYYKIADKELIADELEDAIDKQRKFLEGKTNNE